MLSGTTQRFKQRLSKLPQLGGKESLSSGAPAKSAKRQPQDGKAIAAESADSPQTSGGRTPSRTVPTALGKLQPPGSHESLKSKSKEAVDLSPKSIASTASEFPKSEGLTTCSSLASTALASSWGDLLKPDADTEFASVLPEGPSPRTPSKRAASKRLTPLSSPPQVEGQADASVKAKECDPKSPASLLRGRKESPRDQNDSGRDVATSRTTKEVVNDIHKILRMHSQVSARLGKLDNDQPSSTMCRVSDESKQIFDPFISGYARGHRARQRALPSLQEVVGEVEIRSISPCLKDVGNHYQYFTSIPMDDEGLRNPEDHARRLQHKRNQRVRDRAVMISRRREGKQAQPSMIDFEKSGSQTLLGLSSGELGNGKSSSESHAPGQEETGQEKLYQQKPRSVPHSQTTGKAAAAMKAELRTRDACESLRFLVFGAEGMLGGSKKGKAFYEQRCGTREEVVQLQAVWTQMDEDGSGDVEFQEFLNYFGKSKADRLLGMRCVKYLIGALKDEGDEDEKPQGCGIEDMMKLIWLKAQADDISKMMEYFREAAFETERSPTPPVLPPKKRRELIENFPKIDIPDRPFTIDDIADTGLVDDTVIKDLKNKFACKSKDVITETLLLEMLGPHGYRAHRDVKKCFNADGEPLVHVSTGAFTGWLPVEKATKWMIGATNRTSIWFSEG